MGDGKKRAGRDWKIWGKQSGGSLMNLPLVIFCGVLLGLIAVGMSGMMLFKKPQRRPQRREAPPEEPESQVAQLTPLERDAQHLTEMMALCVGESSRKETVSLFRVRIGSLTDSAPRAAIIKAWRELESASLQTLALYDYGDYPVKRLASLDMMTLLQDNDIFSEAQLDICRLLESIRDDVSGKPHSQISFLAAEQVADTVEWLIDCLEQFRHSVQVDAVEPAA